jgi:hypothetical protein
MPDLLPLEAAALGDKETVWSVDALVDIIHPLKQEFRNTKPVPSKFFIVHHHRRRVSLTTSPATAMSSRRSK